MEAKLKNWMLDLENEERVWSDTWQLCSFLCPELCDFDLELYQVLCFLVMFCCVGNLTVWEDQVARDGQYINIIVYHDIESPR